MKTVILLGTSRQEGNTAALTSTIQKYFSADAISLADLNLSPYDYESSNSDDDFINTIKTLLTYEHIIFASPVYWYSMSGQMKIFVDRLADLLSIEKKLGRQLKDKLCSVISTGGADDVAESFVQPFKLTAGYFDMDYQGVLYCACQSEFVEAEHQIEIDRFVEQINEPVSV